MDLIVTYLELPNIAPQWLFLSNIFPRSFFFKIQLGTLLVNVPAVAGLSTQHLSIPVSIPNKQLVTCIGQSSGCQVHHDLLAVRVAGDGTCPPRSAGLVSESRMHCWQLGMFQWETTTKSLVRWVLMNGFSGNTHHFPVKYFLEIYSLPFMVILDHVSNIFPWEIFFHAIYHLEIIIRCHGTRLYNRVSKENITGSQQW
jgi:hypothetical protein